MIAAIRCWGHNSSSTTADVYIGKCFFIRGLSLLALFPLKMRPVGNFQRGRGEGKWVTWEMERERERERKRRWVNRRERHTDARALCGEICRFPISWMATLSSDTTPTWHSAMHATTRKLLASERHVLGCCCWCCCCRTRSSSSQMSLCRWQCKRSVHSRRELITAPRRCNWQLLSSAAVSSLG